MKKTLNSLRRFIENGKARIQKWWDTQHPFPYSDFDDTLLVPTPSSHIKDSVARKSAIFWGIGILFVILASLVYQTSSYLLLLFVGILLSLALESVIGFWSRLTHSRGVGILIAYSLAVLFCLSGFFILFPFILSWCTEILKAITVFFQGVQSDIATQGLTAYIRSIEWMPEVFQDKMIESLSSADSAALLSTFTENVMKMINVSSSYLKTIGEYVMNFFGGFFVGLGKLVIVFTLAIFSSIFHFKVKYALKYCFRNFEHSKEKIDTIYRSIAIWLKSQLLLCLFIGCASYLGLTILGWFGYEIPHTGVLAILAGLFEIIPYVGPYLGLLPVAVFAIFYHGFWGFLAVVILYILIQQSEEKILVPLLMSKTLGVNAFLIFICMLFGGAILGVCGVIFAVPLAVIVSILFDIPYPTKK